MRLGSLHGWNSLGKGLRTGLRIGAYTAKLRACTGAATVVGSVSASSVRGGLSDLVELLLVLFLEVLFIVELMGDLGEPASEAAFGSGEGHKAGHTLSGDLTFPAKPALDDTKV